MRSKVSPVRSQLTIIGVRRRYFDVSNSRAAIPLAVAMIERIAEGAVLEPVVAGPDPESRSPLISSPCRPSLRAARGLRKPSPRTAVPSFTLRVQAASAESH
jgi:hypothetical protein